MMSEIKALFCLHGFGSDAAMFRAACGPALDGPECCFLDGPETDNYSGRRRWFPFTTRPQKMASGIENGACAAESAIQEELRKMGLGKEVPIGLMGHSQGAMVCLQLLNRYGFNVRKVISLAGHLPSSLMDPLRRDKCKPVQLYLYASHADRYVTVSKVEATAHAFRRVSGVKVNLLVADTLSHDFSNNWLSKSVFREIRSPITGEYDGE